MDPVTGPFTSKVVFQRSGSLELSVRKITSYRQKRPYSKPLPFSFHLRHTTLVSSWANLQADNTVGGVGDFQAYNTNSGTLDGIHSTRVDDVKATAMNKALAKFQAKMSDASETLTSLVESQKTINMVEKRLLSFVAFSKKIRAGSYKSAVREVLLAQKFKEPRLERKRRRHLIKLQGMPRSWWKSKTLAGAWLETWMGWLPTIGDVQKGVQNLSRDFPNEYLTGKSRIRFEYRDQFDTSGPYYSVHKGYAFAATSAVVKVVNPNLYMASQLGLTNPIYTAYQVIPYSWFLSWFNNLNQFFEQFSVYHGVQVDNPCSTSGLLDEHEFNWVNTPAPRGKQYCISFTRSLGLPGVTLQWRGLNRLSLSRGATLTSLLVGWLPRK